MSESSSATPIVALAQNENRSGSAAIARMIILPTPKVAINSKGLVNVRMTKEPIRSLPNILAMSRMRTNDRAGLAISANARYPVLLKTDFKSAQAIG
jgi:hypothetical protein